MSGRPNQYIILYEYLLFYFSIQPAYRQYAVDDDAMNGVRLH